MSAVEGKEALSLKQSPLKTFFVLLGVLLLILGIYYLVVGRGILAEIDETQKSIDTKKIAIANFEATISRLFVVRKKYEKSERDFKSAQTLLPENNEQLEKLLSSFEQTANKRGLSFKYFEPGKEVEKKHFYQKAIKVGFKGSYHNVMAYFSQIVQLERLVVLGYVKMTPVRENYDLENIDAIFYVYWNPKQSIK